MEGHIRGLSKAVVGVVTTALALAAVPTAGGTSHDTNPFARGNAGIDANGNIWAEAEDGSRYWYEPNAEPVLSGGPAARTVVTRSGRKELVVDPTAFGCPTNDYQFPCACAVFSEPAPDAPPGPDGQPAERRVAVNVPALAAYAMRMMRLPAPEIATSPPPTRDQYVQLPTWLWVDASTWRPHSVSVTAGRVTVTAIATPTHVTWDMGNGQQVVCGGPGTPYDHRRRDAEQSTDCAFTYRHSSALQPDQRYTVTATTAWHVVYTVSGAPGGGDLGYTNRSSQVALRVAEIHALNVSGS